MQPIIEFVQLHLMLSLLWVALLGAVVYSYLMPLLSGVKGIPYQQTTQLINQRDAAIVDIRTAEQFRKGHIAGATNLPESQLKSGVPAALDRQKPVIVVCDAGNKASVTARTLKKAGFGEVYYMQGGLNAWTGANLPLVKK